MITIESNVFVYKTITASSPFIEVDLKLSPQQMLMFFHGLKYAVSCQSRFSRQSIDQRVTEQYESITLPSFLHREQTQNERITYSTFLSLRLTLLIIIE